MSYRAAIPSSNTAARLCKPEVSRLPVNLSHKTCTTVDWRLLLLPKNSCTWRNHQQHVCKAFFFFNRVIKSKIQYTTSKENIHVHYRFYSWQKICPSIFCKVVFRKDPCKSNNSYSLFPQDTGLFPKMHPPSAQTDCPQESGLSS